MKFARSRDMAVSESKPTIFYSKLKMTPEDLVAAYKADAGPKKSLYESEALSSITGIIINYAMNYKRYFERTLPESEYRGPLPEPGDVLSEIYLLIKDKRIFDKFDPQRNCRLSTFMKHWVRKVFYRLAKKERPRSNQNLEPFLVSKETPETLLLAEEHLFHSRRGVEQIFEMKYHLSPKVKLTFMNYLALMLAEQNINSRGSVPLKSLLYGAQIQKEGIRQRLEKAKDTVRNELASDDPIFELFCINDSKTATEDKSKVKNLFQDLFVRNLSDFELSELQLKLSSTHSNFTKRRISILLLSAKHILVRDICVRLDIVPATAQKAILDFNEYGFDCLERKSQIKNPQKTTHPKDYVSIHSP